ncbi:hypothetical protein BC739_007848 [Kutzneria viridogrisea]|uniref:Uncharacterized protein n=2 Tax=Kutzneria TaxID=43356 RepID=W5W8L3_9PSEU|nr:hypothetical protein KALB_4109 [Kutzneria albida DSM 43870]MBA8930601.1 hypothetical protein [Kutzneria viridogrisea]
MTGEFAAVLRDSIETTARSLRAAPLATVSANRG